MFVHWLRLQINFFSLAPLPLRVQCEFHITIPPSTVSTCPVT